MFPVLGWQIDKSTGIHLNLLTCFLPENNVVSNGLFWGTQQDRTELMMMRGQNGYIGVTTSSEIYVVGKVHASPDIDGHASSNSISGSNLWHFVYFSKQGSKPSGVGTTWIHTRWILCMRAVTKVNAIPTCVMHNAFIFSWSDWCDQCCRWQSFDQKECCWVIC